MQKKPLITFIVLGYNHEEYVERAIEAAFLQTYSPLEIVLSDDCSSDNTFQIMENFSARYKGKHRVILNRNTVRKSIGGHINKVMALSNGELVIASAADDISLPNRTEVIYDVWQKSKYQASSIHSRVIQINEKGQEIEQIIKSSMETDGKIIEQNIDTFSYIKTLSPGIFGCAHAWTRKLFDVFGDLPEEIIHEDNCVMFRSLLAGKVYFTDEKLVQYRLHGGNVYLREQKLKLNSAEVRKEEEKFRNDAKNRETMYKCFALDLLKAKKLKLIKENEFDILFNETKRLESIFKLKWNFYNCSFFRKLLLFHTLWKLGATKKELKFLVPRLIPNFILLRLRILNNRIKFHRLTSQKAKTMSINS